MHTVIFVVLLGALIAFLVWRFTRTSGSDAMGAPPSSAPPPEQLAALAQGPRYRPWTPPPPVEPSPLTTPSDWTPPPELAELTGLRAFQRVADDCAMLDISPDGREVMALHDDASITIFDVASGRAIKTWRDICPPEWLEYLGESCVFSCAGRRIFLGWEIGNTGASENVLIDLEKREVTRLYEAEDGQDAIMCAAISADGGYAVGFVTYGESHPAFDLGAPMAGEFGDLVLEPGTIWPEVVMSRDGRWFAFDQGAGDVYVMERAGEPESLDAPGPLGGPDYGEHMVVSGDDRPDQMDFDETGERLLVLEGDGGLIVVDLAARDFRLLKPFPVFDESPVFLGVTWINGRDQAILEMVRPESKLILVDLAEGAIVREWPVGEATLRRMKLARTGGFGLVGGDDGALRVLPLLDEAA